MHVRLDDAPHCAVQVTGAACEVLQALAQWVASQLDASAGAIAQSVIAGELRALLGDGSGDKGGDDMCGDEEGSPVADRLSSAGSGSPTLDAGVAPFSSPACHFQWARQGDA
jgi:hypothetical protein